MKYRPTIVLDACSIINLIYIEIGYGSDVLFNRLKSDAFCIYFCDKVIDEVSKNAKIELNRQRKWGRKSTSFRKNVFDEDEREIEEKIATFRKFTFRTEQIIADQGKEYYNHVKALSRYKKDNGEFYSAALSLYLSRKNKTQLTFYTDDLPAHGDFCNFFNGQQIGKIEDTVDLLVFIYWYFDDFDKRQLETCLSELRSQYTTDIKRLSHYIKGYKEKQSNKSLKSIRKPLDALERKLNQFELEGINDIRKELYKHKNKHKSICDIIDEFDKIFRIESKGNNMIEKIKKTLKNLNENRIYKISVTAKEGR